MGEYLTFKKLITPALIQVLFWLAVIGNTISALFYSGGFLPGLAQLILGPIFIRVFCEGMIVIFEISNTLAEIRDNQIRLTGAAPAAAPSTLPPAS